jgi:transcriptional regulator with XRE-family HTH domain
MRVDAAMSVAALARAAGLDPSFVGEIESGTANPSLESCKRLALVLGADLPLRLYPTTGPVIHDRLQAPIAEFVIAVAHPRWKAYVELAVRRPSRGWIDLGLHDAAAAIFIATEIQSELRRIEQLFRWSEAKAAALPSWEGWPHLGAEPSISRLLIVRETRTNRAIAHQHRRLLRAVYPGDSRDALEALKGTVAWPGAAVLWAARNRLEARSYRLVARP